MGFVNAQNPEIDSLKKVLEYKRSTPDTARANLLYKIAFAYFQIGGAESKTYLKQAKQLSDSLDFTLGKAKVAYLSGIFESQKSNYAGSLDYFNISFNHYKSINDKKGQAVIHTAFGITHFMQSEYNQALAEYKKALDIYEEVGNEEDKLTTMTNIANVYTDLGRYDEAIAIYDELIRIHEKSNNESQINTQKHNKAFILRMQGKYIETLRYFNDVLQYHEKNNDSFKIANVLNAIGDTYRSFGNEDKALLFHKKSLKIAILRNDKRLEAINYTNIGNVYSKKELSDSALYYFVKGLEISKEVNDITHEILAQLNIGQAYIKLNQLDTALYHLSEAKQISSQINYPRGLCISNILIGEIYFEKSEFIQSMSLLQEGRKVAKELGLIDIQKKALEIIQQIYEDRGDFEKAYYTHQEYKVLSDSLINKEKIEEVALLEYEFKFKHELDSAKIRELRLSKMATDANTSLRKVERKYLWAIISILSLILIAGAVIFYLRIRNLNARTQNIEIEQKLLRSQMTPHFIFNSLSVLQGMILNKEQEKSVLYLSKFSKLLRLTLENSRDKEVLLTDELEVIKNYLNLQDLEDNTYEFVIDVANNIESNSLYIPPMLIQPFVENAIEHAFKNQREGRRIEINLRLIKGKLICQILDNGDGINKLSAVANKSKNSLATKITEERLKVLAKHYKMNGSITIENRNKFNEQGTVVTLEIPYKFR